MGETKKEPRKWKPKDIDPYIRVQVVWAEDGAYQRASLTIENEEQLAKIQKMKYDELVDYVQDAEAVKAERDLVTLQEKQKQIEAAIAAAKKKVA